MQRAAEAADRDLRERELLERRSWQLTMAKYFSSGQYPKMDDSLRSQIAESVADVSQIAAEMDVPQFRFRSSSQKPRNANVSQNAE